jgi:hypothetical protein
MKKRIQLIGAPNQRNFDSLQSLVSAKDQRYINGILGVVQNPLSRSLKVYFEKRPGLETNITPASGSTGEIVFFSRSQNKFVSAFATGAVYVGTTSCGSTS